MGYEEEFYKYGFPLIDLVLKWYNLYVWINNVLFINFSRVYSLFPTWLLQAFPTWCFQGKSSRKKNCSQGKILQQKFTDQILTTLQHFGLLISRDLEGVKQPNLYHSMSTSISLKILSQKVSKLKVHFLISIFFHPQLLQRVR